MPAQQRGQFCSSGQADCPPPSTVWSFSCSAALPPPQWRPRGGWVQLRSFSNRTCNYSHGRWKFAFGLNRQQSDGELIPQQLIVELADLACEVQLSSADGAGETGLAPVVDALAMVLMAAGCSSDLVSCLELQEADGAGLSFLCLLLFILVGKQMGDEDALGGAVVRDRHEDLQIVETVFGMRPRVFWVQALQFPAEPVEIGLQVEGVDLQLESVEGVLAAEVGDEGGEQDQEDEGSEENEESTEIGGLQVDLSRHPYRDLLSHLACMQRGVLNALLLFILSRILTGKLLAGGQRHPVLLLLLSILHRPQADHDLPEALILPTSDADVVRGEGGAVLFLEVDLRGFEQGGGFPQ